jgi:hypothetical protein
MNEKYITAERFGWIVILDLERNLLAWFKVYLLLL